MGKTLWLIATLGVVTLTAGCVEDNRYYPNTGYNAPRSGNYWNSAHRDADRDGVPNRYDRDANGDGVPDRYQSRPRY
ncbi:hypothetical protein [Reyranella sp.]|uniref:hypothetical protein n=1 Tax=Reyranella sp. TaxID=1929291 RepID=UPI003D1117E5